MKRLFMLSMTLVLATSQAFAIGPLAAATETSVKPPVQQSGAQNNYSIEQAMSDNAQLSTIAFSGLAFITGSDGADTFMPPGKVADFFGFQYMRDVDVAGYGHNTTFLSKAANNMLSILTSEQKAKLVALAKEQAPLYVKFAYNRFPLMNAFRRSLEGDIPSGSTGLSLDAVAQYTGQLYGLDADLSYNRAIMAGSILSQLSDSQKAYLDKMKFTDSSTWPDVAEDETLKKSMSNTEFVAVMTYASEMFSWYKGSVEADIYFCPERHGTYFGGFYMKDYPAMNNPDYFISTAITGDKGKMFLDILNDSQKSLITSIISLQKNDLQEIASIRTQVSNELRKAMSGEEVDKTLVYNLIKRYGQLDGRMSGLYATQFSKVNQTLTDSQRAALVKLRDLSVVPQGAYLFSAPVAMPSIPNNDFLFGVGSVSSSAGQYDAPATFTEQQRATNGAAPADKPAQPGTGTAPSDKPAQPNTGANPPSGGAAKPSQAPADRPVKILVGSTDIKFTVPPFVTSGKAMAPSDKMTAAMGMQFTWDGTSKQFTVVSGSKSYQFEIGKNTYKVGNTTGKLDTAPVQKNKTIFVPVASFAKVFGYSVQWDGQKKIITLNNK